MRAQARHQRKQGVDVDTDLHGSHPLRGYRHSSRKCRVHRVIDVLQHRGRLLARGLPGRSQIHARNDLATLLRCTPSRTLVGVLVHVVRGGRGVAELVVDHVAVDAAEQRATLELIRRRVRPEVCTSTCTFVSERGQY